MARTSTRTLEEVEQMLAAFQESGLTKRQFCDQQRIPLTTLEYYRQRHRKQAGTSEAGELIKVELQHGGRSEDAAQGFSLVLAKGRRIESHWNYDEQKLTRLIRIVEAA
jgi:hypothetical protein